MYPTIRRLVRTYLERRTPWGAPWWVYAVVLGAANLARQAVLWRSDPGTAVTIASFVAMVLIVFGAVTGAVLLLRRHPLRRPPGPAEGAPEQLSLWAGAPDAGPAAGRLGTCPG